MADLKLGTTVGGSSIWHQGNFPLVPTGNSLTYNGYLVYSENDKPQASDNDFVSKASGGTFASTVNFGQGIQINANFNSGSNQNGIYSGEGDGASQANTNINLVSWYGFGIKSSQNGVKSIWINTRTGDFTSIGSITANQYTANATAPTQSYHLTRKDYVDTNINNVTSNANSRVLRAGDTMSGNLTAPNFISNNAATSAAQVPRLDQVITKGTVIDFGTY